MPLRNQPTSLGGLPIQIDYTARDYDSILAELLKVASQLTPEWTDREPGDIGVTLLESMAYVSDILSYQLDRVQNESYLGSAQTREAVVSLLRLIGYELAPATPATVAMVVRTNQDNVVLPEGFTVRTEGTNQLDALEYQLEEDVQLGLAGLYCVSYERNKVTRIFGEPTATDDRLVFTAGQRVQEGIGISDGTPDQIFLLPSSPVCLGVEGGASIQVTINGDLYEARTSFIGTEPTDNVFTYRFLSTEEVIIKFGDGVNGRIPPAQGPIIVSYRINGGEETNRAGVGSITEFDRVEGLVEVYNANQPSGGSDPEDIYTAKKKAPLSLRALDRCVTLNDFEIMSQRTPGLSIRTARATQGDSPLDVNIYVATEGDNPVPNGRWYDQLQNGWGAIGAVGRWLNQKKPVPTRIKVLAPTVVNPYLEAEVFVYPNLLRQTVEFDVDQTLQVLFNEITSEFGQDIPLSRIIQAIENTRGVDYVNVRSFHRLPSLRYLRGNENSFEGVSLSITNMSPQMTRGTYHIEWLNDASYQVRAVDRNELITDENGDTLLLISGVNGSIAFYNSRAIDTELRQENQFDLYLEVGGILPRAGDTWEFSVDNYLGNIETKDHEIVVSPIQSDGRLNTDQFKLTYLGGI